VNHQEEFAIDLTDPKDESGDGSLLKSSGEKVIGVWGVLRKEAMAEDVREDFLDVIREDGGLIVEEGSSLRSSLESERGAGGDGMILPYDGSNSLAKFEKVALQGVGDGNMAGFFLKFAELVETHDW
jgi:hypothetical protein